MTSKIKKGFDRDVDYEPMKVKLVEEYNRQIELFFSKKSRITRGHILIYLLILMIQLRNGSRISEAVNAFRLFLKDGIKELVVVKIAKSEGIKNRYDRKTGTVEQITTKARYRKIKFPDTWINTDNIEELFYELIKYHEEYVNQPEMKRRILNYMNRNYKCNTHSLRYAFINHMIYVQKRPLNDVAKFVGHSNTNQLVTYTQQKNCDQIFDLDI